MSTIEKKEPDVAREYYNSSDADTFYHTIWGGEDIHIGMYQSKDDTIYDASRRTVRRMAKLAGKITPSTRVLDIGAGYGGSARFLAKKYECSVVCLNISEVENERNRILNTKQRLNHLIEVIDGTFDDVPFEDGSFDIVWSQDAILHSCDREKVLEEVARVLKPGGRFIFTDPMKNDECPDEVLQPILDRIQLDDLGCPRFYRKTARRFGLKEVAVEDHSEQIANHYGKVLQETESNADKLKGKVSKNYITRMKKGLKHWINGGRKGHLAWSIFVFQKKK